MTLLSKLTGIALIIVSPSMFAMSDEEKNLLGTTDSVKWLEDIPIEPAALVGRVYYIEDGSTTHKPFFLNINLAVKEVEESVVLESVLKTALKGGKISFAGLIEFQAETKMAAEFQVVQGRRWHADPNAPQYKTALYDFARDFKPHNKNAIKEVFFVQGVLKRKIWYRTFTEKTKSANWVHAINVGGREYVSASDYKEHNQYGLLLVPIKTVGVSIFDELPNRRPVEAIAAVKVPDSVINELPSSVVVLDESQSIAELTPVQAATKIGELDGVDRKRLIEAISNQR